MRTENPEPGRLLGRLRAPLARAGGWFARRPQAPRLAIALAAVAVLGSALYLANPAAPPGRAWLEGGRAFSRDDSRRIARALDAAGIEHARDEQGRIQVAADRLQAALAALSKAKVVPPSVPDILNQIREPAGWEAPSDREQRVKAGVERALETMIENLPGIDAASVFVQRERARGGLRADWTVAAFVYLSTRRDRGLNADTIRAIQNFLVGAVPGLKPDAINLVDDHGREYLAAGNPQLRVKSLTRAREDELADEIAESLDWIPGVRVKVRIEPTAASAATPIAEAPATTPAPMPIAVASTAPLPMLPPAAIEPTAAPNRPVELDPEPQPEVEPAPGPVVAAPEADPTPAAPEAPGKVSVWVQVPRSYYLRELNAPGAPAAGGEVGPLAARVEAIIRSAVAGAVAQGEAEVKVDTIPDTLEPFRATAAGPTVEARRGAPAWLPASAAASAAGVLILAAAARALAVRRPARSRRPAPDPARPRFDPAEAAVPGPGPTERVRDLVRHNPEAAAGVLQRWIGQGGQTA